MSQIFESNPKGSTLMLAIILFLPSIILCQDLDAYETSRANGGFYNVLVSLSLERIESGSRYNPSYNGFGIAFNPRFSKHLGFTLTHNQLFLVDRDKYESYEWKKPESRHIQTSFGIQGIIPISSIAIFAELKGVMANKFALMFGFGLERRISENISIRGALRFAPHNFNLVDGTNYYSDRTVEFGLSYSLVDKIMTRDGS